MEPWAFIIEMPIRAGWKAMIQTRERSATHENSLASSSSIWQAHPLAAMRSNKYARLSELIFANSSTFSPNHTRTVDPGRFKWSSNARNVSPLEPPPDRKAEPFKSCVCTLYADRSLQEKPVTLIVEPSIDADKRQPVPSSHDVQFAFDTLSMSSKTQHVVFSISA